MATTSTSTYVLHGWKLRLAQLAWGVIVLFFLGFFLLYFPGNYQGYLGLQPIIAKWLHPYGGAIWLALYQSAWDIITSIVFSVIAFFIIRRNAQDWFGMIASATLLAFGVGFSVSNYSAVLYNPLISAAVTNRLDGILNFIALGLVLVFLFLFPDGRFVPSWMRWPLLAVGLWLLGRVFIPVLDNYTINNLQIFYAVQIVSSGAGLAAQIYRYHRVSTPLQRQQTKWVILGIAVTVVGYALFIMLWGSVGAPLYAELLDLFVLRPLFYAPRILLAGMLGFSVLRYRLWDVDFIINRSLVYGALSVLLVTCFGVSLLLISWLFKNLAGGPLVAVALAAAGFGFTFRPIHHALQRFVDQRFYNIQVDYLKPAPVTPASGDSPIHIDRYADPRFIGRGGMADVYQATDVNRKQTVAIKVLRVDFGNMAELQKRFQREAQVMSQLEHPNIIRLLDYGQTDNHQYIAMEYVEGLDLSEYLQRHGPLSLEMTRAILSPLAAALDYIHEQGLVHRDVKPSNVMLVGEGAALRPILMDFGIVKQLHGGTLLTAADGLIGTLDYIAPEQIQGEENLDGSADLYALGVTAYQMLAHELPFKQQNPGALLIAHLTQPPPNLHELHPEISVTIAWTLQRALAKKREERFANASEFVSALE